MFVREGGGVGLPSLLECVRSLLKLVVVAEAVRAPVDADSHECSMCMCMCMCVCVCMCTYCVPAGHTPIVKNDVGLREEDVVMRVIQRLCTAPGVTGMLMDQTAWALLCIQRPSACDVGTLNAGFQFLLRAAEVGNCNLSAALAVARSRRFARAVEILERAAVSDFFSTMPSVV
jgi:hypothetical protein